MSADVNITSTNGTLARPTATIIEEWLEHERLRGATENTLKAYRKGIYTFVDWFSENGIGSAQVTPKRVREFKAALAEQYSAQTVNLRLSALRSFYRFVVNGGYLPYNPAAEVRGMRRPKSKTHKRDALANGEILAVLDTCDSDTVKGIRDRAILGLMAYCALREIEIHRANIGHLKTKGDRLVLEVQGKGRLEADELMVVPYQEEPVIRAWQSRRLKLAQHDDDAPLFISLSNRSHGQRLALRSIRALVKAHYESADVVGKKKTTHSLRHSAITNAIRRGASPMQVQAMARHASFDTTLGYYHEVGRLDNPAEDLIRYSRNE